MPDLRPVAHVLGLMLMLLGGAMLLPVLAVLIGGGTGWQIFFLSSLACLFPGGLLSLTFRDTSRQLDRRQAFLLVVMAWAFLPLFAALPFMQAGPSLSLTDAYFEAMSGLTTTGATVMSGLDRTAKAILFWRAMLQWLGGVGIIVMALALLPLLRIGGMHLFRLESSDKSDKTLPRTAELTSWIAVLYATLSLMCALLLLFSGMPLFDAVSHTMTTISTGGYSTHDASIAHYDSVAIELVIILFMLIGSLPFGLILQAVRGRPLAFWRDEQVRGFFVAMLLLIGVIAVWLVANQNYRPDEAVRFASFNVLSLMTGTGYASHDYGQWGSFGVTAMMMIMLCGGCAGSTSCGIKIFRWQILLKHLRVWSKQVMRPHGVFLARYNNRPIDQSVTNSVMVFLFLMAFSLILLSTALMAVGLDFLTAVSGAVSSLSNVGPGLGDIIGPTGNFASLPDPAKWLLSLGMLMGRLELFAVLVLFTPGFWRG